MEQVINNLTTYERLDAELFGELDPYIIPENLTEVTITFEIAQVSFQTSHSFMQTRGVFELVNIL